MSGEQCSLIVIVVAQGLTDVHCEKMSDLMLRSSWRRRSISSISRCVFALCCHSASKSMEMTGAGRGTAIRLSGLKNERQMQQRPRWLTPHSSSAHSRQYTCPLHSKHNNGGRVRGRTTRRAMNG